MMKLIIVGRRAPGRTRTQAHAYLRDVHARMVVCPPAGSGAMPLDYVQNHVFDGVYPAAGDHAIERDLVTELWFESVDHLRTATATPYYLDTLQPDEPRFVDDATVEKMMVRPDPVREGARGRFKAFFFLASVAAAKSFDLPTAGAVVQNLVMAPPGGGTPFAAVIFEGWFQRSTQALRAVEAFGTHCRADAQSFAVAAEEYDSARLRTCHSDAAGPK